MSDRAASSAATNSASMVLWTTDFCLLDDHMMCPPALKKHQPVWLVAVSLQSANDASTKPVRCLFCSRSVSFRCFLMWSGVRGWSWKLSGRYDG
jgi:hypothetical protein